MDAYGYFFAERSADIDARRIEQAALVVAQAKQREANEKINQLIAESFNQSLGIPVSWSPAIKDVLSGLSEDSKGNGRSARTVIHALLNAPLSAGKLTRNTGDFLCTSPADSNGQNYGQESRECCEAVTCRACLTIALKLSAKKPNADYLLLVDDDQLDGPIPS